MFRFVHAADLHLDSPYEGLGDANPSIRQKLVDASLRAWDRLVDLAISTGSAFVVLSGDIYDGPQRGVRAQLRFLKGLERLRDSKISVFIAHGNHDPLDGWSAIERWPDNITIFDGTTVQSFPVLVDGKPIAVVHGISYPQARVEDNLAILFKAIDLEVESGIHQGPSRLLQVGVLHCNVGSVVGYENYAPCSLQDLKDTGIDYWALGHVHSFSRLSEESPCVVYPGCLQGRSHKPGECGHKGAVVVEAEGDRVLGVKFYALAEVRFEELQIDVSSCSDLGAVRSSLVTGAQKLIGASSRSGLVLRAVLTGRGPVHALLTNVGALVELLQSVRDEFEDADPFVWWDSLRDSTCTDLDIAAIRGRGDYSSIVVALADRLMSDDELAQSFFDRHCSELIRKVGHIGIGKGPEDRRALLERALATALDLLEGGREL